MLQQGFDPASAMHSIGMRSGQRIARKSRSRIYNGSIANMSWRHRRHRSHLLRARQDDDFCCLAGFDAPLASNNSRGMLRHNSGDPLPWMAKKDHYCFCPAWRFLGKTASCRTRCSGCREHLMMVSLPCESCLPLWLLPTLSSRTLSRYFLRSDDMGGLAIMSRVQTRRRAVRQQKNGVLGLSATRAPIAHVCAPLSLVHFTWNPSGHLFFVAHGRLC